MLVALIVGRTQWALACIPNRQGTRSECHDRARVRDHSYMYDGSRDHGGTRMASVRVLVRSLKLPVDLLWRLYTDSPYMSAEVTMAHGHGEITTNQGTIQKRTCEHG